MATSGVTINQLSRDDIINAALRKLVVIGEGQSANPTQIITASQALNNIVAEFRTLGMSLWARKYYNLVPIVGQQDYVFGVGQAVNVAYPLKIYNANYSTGPTYDSKISMNQLAFIDFNLLPDGSSGAPVNFKYQPKINQGTMTIWPTPDAGAAQGRIEMEYQAPFEYFVAGVDTPDFPEEWNNALIYQLAVSLTDEYGTPMQKQQWLEKQADKHIGTALSGGTEEASLFIQRDWSGDY